MDMFQWQCTKCSAFWRRQIGDIEGAIADMRKAVEMTRSMLKLAKETADALNYLADLYLLAANDGRAEEALRESIALSRPRYPHLLSANFWILGSMQLRQGRVREAMASAEESLQEARRLLKYNDYAVRRAEELAREVRGRLAAG
jgi:tetratricopeptide (TPR) repeat protein